MNAAEFQQELLSGDLSRCISATTQATLVGDEAIDIAVELLADRLLPRETRFWSLQSLGQFGKVHPSRVASSAASALSDPDPGIQAVALQILEQLRYSEAAEAIGALLGSATRDPTDWSDEPRSIGTAAEETLRAIGSPEAIALLSDRKAGA